MGVVLTKPMPVPYIRRPIMRITRSGAYPVMRAPEKYRKAATISSTLLPAPLYVHCCVKNENDMCRVA
jgi:hypothetical protein